MSNTLFPSLPGQAWPLTFSPAWNTQVKTSVSGREVRAAFQAIPISTVTLTFEFLRPAHKATLRGFFMALRGRWDSFLLDAGDDSLAADMPFATGDGSTKSFQLANTMGSFSESAQNIGAVTGIKAAGTTVSSGLYSLGTTGIVTFITAPATGAALVWSGTFYYRCRLDQDAIDFEQFMQRLYTVKTLKLKGSPSNKLL